MKKRPDLLLLIAIWQFLNAFLCLIGMAAIAIFAFPGYTVIDENDYLEIDYYVESILGPDNDTGYLQLLIDDDTLGEANQTRIEG